MQRKLARRRRRIRGKCKRAGRKHGSRQNHGSDNSALSEKIIHLKTSSLRRGRGVFLRPAALPSAAAQPVSSFFNLHY